MSPENRQNRGHSVFQRLLNRARAQGEDFNLLLSRYGIERFLYRLSVSSYAEEFILKGAGLFLVWEGINYRTTKDADFMGLGSPDLSRILGIFQELCSAVIDVSDGISFRSDTLQAMEIREDQAYDEIRVTLTAKLHNARIPLQIDIGFGDAITPSPEKVNYPTLLAGPNPSLLAVPRYTMVAEKLEAMVRLGIANSRMKDFYDLWLSSRLFDFDGPTLCMAIKRTFERRSTRLPEQRPFAFTDEFKEDAQKQIQWKSFLKKSKPKELEKDLSRTIEDIAEFLSPILKALRKNEQSQSHWDRDRHWQ